MDLRCYNVCFRYKLTIFIATGIYLKSRNIIYKTPSKPQRGDMVIAKKRKAIFKKLQGGDILQIAVHSQHYNNAMLHKNINKYCA